MKNVFIGIILLCCLLLTGCSNNEITCVIESNHDDIGFISKTEVIGVIKGDNVTKYNLKVTVTFDDEDLAISSYNTIIAGYDDEEIVFKRKKKVIIGTSTVNINELVTKYEFAEKLEEEGYTCK